MSLLDGIGVPGWLSGIAQAAFLCALGSAWRGRPCARHWQHRSDPWAGAYQWALCVFSRSRFTATRCEPAITAAANRWSHASSSGVASWIAVGDGRVACRSPDCSVGEHGLNAMWRRQL